MAETPTTTAVRDLERLDARDELVGAAMHVLAGAQRLRTASDTEPLTDDELLGAMTTLRAAFGELGDAVETTRRRLGSETPASDVKRRLNELASAAHAARHNAALVARALKGEAAGPVIIVNDGVDHQSVGAFSPSGSPSWCAGRLISSSPYGDLVEDEGEKQS